MVWDSISLNALTDPVVVDCGTITAEKYILVIWQQYVVEFAPYISKNFIIMQDPTLHPQNINKSRNLHHGLTTSQFELESNRESLEHLWHAIDSETDSST